jgi:hypothetical protein
MVSVAQWLEHWTVAPVVGGSSPLTHPSIFCFTKSAVISNIEFLLIPMTCAPVAQLDRASASGAEGRRFESSQARLYKSCGPLAQLVEQLTLNQRVAGSNPARLTINFKGFSGT